MNTDERGLSQILKIYSIVLSSGGVDLRRIERFARKHPDVRSWLDAWQRTAEGLDWTSIRDIRQTYPAADGGVKVASGGTVTVFNVGGNKYRMICSVVYAAATIIVHKLMTHSEYSKNLWKEKY